MKEANLGPASDGGEAATCVVGRGEEIRVAWMALAILLGTTVIHEHKHVRRHEVTPQSGQIETKTSAPSGNIALEPPRARLSRGTRCHVILYAPTGGIGACLCQAQA
ncbi:hypothetical protein ISCGN_020756 [Ixodes scapularis]